MNIIVPCWVRLSWFRLAVTPVVDCHGVSSARKTLPQVVCSAFPKRLGVSSFSFRCLNFIVVLRHDALLEFVQPGSLVQKTEELEIAKPVKVENNAPHVRFHEEFS